MYIILKQNKNKEVEGNETLFKTRKDWMERERGAHTMTSDRKPCAKSTKY